MGVVYEVFDRERRAPVALKTLKRLDPQAIYRFKNEFRALADLDHENLVRLHELHCEDGVWFFTMEIVRGETFLAHVRPASSALDPADDTVVRPRPRYDEPRLRASLAQLARGVAALHAAGKVHRDIKPSNVMVTPEGRTVLLDFGLVTEMSAAETSATDTHIVGTAAYMAPEQGLAKPVGPEADWYAVGSMLFEALTGRPPFTGGTIDLLLEKQQYEPPPPRQLMPDVPPDLDALCLALLRTDPRARLSDAQVLARLGVGDAGAAITSSRSFTQSPPFVGRTEELAALGAALADAQKSAVAFFIHGESGIGKSALVRRFLEALEHDGKETLVLSACCYERESVPYKAFDGIIDGLSHHLRRVDQALAGHLLPDDAPLLARLFPVLRRVPAMSQLPLPKHDSPNPQEVRTRAFLALRKLLTRLGQRRPLVLFVDDFQWADADSLALLAELLALPDPPPLLLAATVRTSETPACQAIGELPGDVRQLHMQGLSPDEARALIAQLGPAQLADTPIAEESRGHPLFLQELVRYASTTGFRAPRDVRLEDALWSRIEPLEAPARRMLEILALASAPLPQRVAIEAAGQRLPEANKWISLLRLTFLVRTGAREPDSIELYHDRVRQALLARLHETTRRSHHRALATALESAGGAIHDPRLLVHHLEAAGEPLRAAQEAERAAHIAAGTLAFDHAAELYSWALRLGNHNPAEKRQLLIELGDALVNAGRGPEAARVYVAAADGAENAHALDLRRRAAEQLLISGHTDEGVAAIRAVLGALDMTLPETPMRAFISLLLRRAMLRLRGLKFRQRAESDVAPNVLARVDICCSVALGLGLVDSIRGSDFQTRHLLLALAAGEPRRVARAMSLEAAYSAGDGSRGARRTARLVKTAETLADQVNHPYALGLARSAGGLTAFLEGRFRDGQELLEQAEQRLLESRGSVPYDVFEIDSVRAFHLNCLAFRGNLNELLRRRPILVREAQSRGDRYALMYMQSGLHIIGWLATDDIAGARAIVEQTAEYSGKGAIRVPHYLEFIARVQIDLYTGDGDAGWQRVLEWWPRLRHALLLHVEYLRINTLDHAGRAALASRNLKAALKFARKLGRERAAWAAPLHATVRAGAAILEADAEAARRWYEQALEGFGASHMDLHAACVRRRLGELGAAEMLAKSDEWMRSQAVAQPALIANVLAPAAPLPLI